MDKLKRSWLNYFFSAIISMGVLAGTYAFFQNKYNLFVVSLFIIWCGNILFCLCKLRENFVFFIFQIAMFTFLISRPFIAMFRGEKWWEQASQASQNIWFALTAIMTAEIALFIGMVLADRFVKNNKNSVVNAKKQEFISILQNFSLVVFAITMCFYLIEQFEPLIVLRTGNYLEYYSDFQSTLPSVFHSIASFMKYSLAIFLSTFPVKRKAFVPLLLYVISMVPSLVIGVRNPFILSILFSLSYYVIRDYAGAQEKWIGKFEKILIAVCAPFGIIFMGIYAYIRSGLDALTGGWNPLELLADFFYGQGVSFNILTIGYGYRVGLRIMEPVNYTFGGFIDYIYRGTIGQKIFGTEPLTSYNSDFNAMNSNSLSHALSKLYLEDEYLKGRGIGSSFVLENYIDFGYIGIFLFSLVLGILLVCMVKKFGKNWLLSTIILVTLMNLYFMPRAEATSCVTFIITVQFWVCVVGVYVGTCILVKANVIHKIKSVMRR